MEKNSENGWNEGNLEAGTFGDLLERMTTQFAPNHGSSHYQSGFVPAATPPWPSQHTHPHVLSIDPSLNATALGTHVGLNPLRSYSVSQPPYPDMEPGRTPLLRSSSDLGIRLGHFAPHRNNYQDCRLEGILDHHVESLDSTPFYTDNSHLSPPNASHYQHLPTTKTDEIIGNQHPVMHYNATYMAEPESSIQQEQASKFSTKLSNFTASLGTWLSPFDQICGDYSNSVQVPGMSGNVNRIQENITENIQPSTIDNVSESVSGFSNESKPEVATKPRYSDVLSKAPIQEGKAPIQEGKSFSNTSKSVSFQSNSNFKLRETLPKSSNNNRSNKSNRNSTGYGRSNSPNAITNNSNGNNISDFSINSKHNSKIDSSTSKVGLDDFDLPVGNNTSGSLSHSNGGSSTKSYPSDAERTKKRTSLNSDESSPGHQPKKGFKNEVKHFPEKIQEISSLSEADKVHCDKLNNHILSTQQKQTPKRTTYINNNFTSLAAGVNASKTNNTDNGSSNSFQHRKTIPVVKDEVRFQLENSGGGVTNKYPSCPGTSNNSSATPSASSSNAGTQSSSSSSSSARLGGSSSRSGRYANKAERSKDNQSKKTLYNNNKKKKESLSPYCHSELLMTGWTMCLLWIGIAAKAGFWLLSLIVDVAQMSYRLVIHFSLRLWERGKVYQHEAKLAVKKYWAKIFNGFFQKKTDGKIGGRNDRKSPFGLENNIPLPTTGEEAMKRLLACRGKDPYSILGVIRDCTDDDIKKYYKRQAFLVHPDKNKQPGAEEAFKILAHAFEIIGEPERREQYDTKLAEEVHLEGATGELASLLNLLKEKLEEAANTIRCTNCNKRHRRVKLPRPVYAARHCAECQIRHAAREGDIWAESWHIGIWWKYYACMEGAIYDISDWASCQRENLKHLQANTHSVQYRIVSGKKNTGGKNSTPECPTDPELEEFFNNLCRERFGQDFVPGNNQTGTPQTSSSDARKRRGKKKK